jgi:hypothetical protein
MQTTKCRLHEKYGIVKKYRDIEINRNNETEKLKNKHVVLSLGFRCVRVSQYSSSTPNQRSTKGCMIDITDG